MQKIVIQNATYQVQRVFVGTKPVCDVIQEARQRCDDGNFHAYCLRSQAIFVFMPWPG